jgi:hypothetical protein
MFNDAQSEKYEHFDKLSVGGNTGAEPVFENKLLFT